MTKKKAHGSEGKQSQPKIYNTVSFIQIKNKCAHTKTGTLKDIKREAHKTHWHNCQWERIRRDRVENEDKREQTGTNGRHRMTTRTVLTSSLETGALGSPLKVNEQRPAQRQKSNFEKRIHFKYFFKQEQA